MSEYLDKSEAVGEGYLQDWYISSVSADDEPVWTENETWLFVQMQSVWQRNSSAQNKDRSKDRLEQEGAE